MQPKEKFAVVLHGASNVVLSVPDDGSCDRAASLLRQGLAEKFAVDVALTTGVHSFADSDGPNVIALGCLADNPCIEALYLRFRTLVDRWYPGSGGYVLQSVHFAGSSGPDVLIVGGSAPQGVLMAAQRFLDKMCASADGCIDWQLEVKLGEDHFPLPDERIDVLGTSASPMITPESALPHDPYRSAYAGGSIENHLLRLGMYGPHANNSHFCRSSQFALRYLYTGDRKDAKLYRDTLLEEIQGGVIRRLYHYKSIRMFQLWELLSPSPIFSDADRAVIDEALLDYLLHGTGVAAVDTIKAQSTGNGIFDRHTACDVLNLWFGADYFGRLTGESRWGSYRDIADQYFRKQVGTDVPYTGLTEGYYTYLEVYLEWLINSCPEAVLRDPHVRLWAERVVGLCTNQGTLVVGAQSEERRFCYNLMRKLAFLLRDGRYLFVSKLRERFVSRGRDDRISQFSAGQAYAGDMTPQVPEDVVGLTVFPMNERLRRWKAPSVPPGAGFDRGVGRSGWSVDDDYFMVIGVRGGGKVLPNVGALAAYERFGVSLLASPVLALRAEENSPVGYSVVTVTQNGLGATIHEGAIVIGQWQLSGLEIFTISMNAEARFHWYRTFCWKPGGFLLVVDRVVSHTDGEFTVSANWRCSRPLTVQGPTAWCDCTSPEGKHSRFFVQTSAPALGYDQHPQCQVDEVPAPETPCLPVLHAVVDGRVPEDRSVRIATLMHAASDGGGAVYRACLDQNGVIVTGEDCTILIRGVAEEREPSVERIPGQHHSSTASRSEGRRIIPRSKETEFTVLWRAPIEAEPRCWTAHGDGELLAFGDGRGICTVIGPDGTAAWRQHCGAPVTAMAFLGHDLLVGTQAGIVQRFNPDGKELWSYQCRFRPERDFWSWWFLKTPYVGAIRAGSDKHTGNSFVAVGTGSCALNVLTADCGELVADVISPYGLADHIQAHLFSETGELRFFVAHSRLTCSSSVRAWSPFADTVGAISYDRGFGDQDIRSPGWDMCGVADFCVQDLHGIVEQVVVLRYGTFNQIAAYDRNGVPLWMQPLGGVPLSLARLSGDGGEERTAVAERFGWVSLFDSRGQLAVAERVTDRLSGMAASVDGELVLWGPDRVFRGDIGEGLSAARFHGVPLGYGRIGGHEGLFVCRDGFVCLGEA